MLKKRLKSTVLAVVLLWFGYFSVTFAQDEPEALNYKRNLLPIIESEIADPLLYELRIKLNWQKLKRKWLLPGLSKKIPLEVSAPVPQVILIIDAVVPTNVVKQIMRNIKNSNVLPAESTLTIRRQTFIGGSVDKQKLNMKVTLATQPKFNIELKTNPNITVNSVLTPATPSLFAQIMEFKLFIGILLFVFCITLFAKQFYRFAQQRITELGNNINSLGQSPHQAVTAEAAPEKPTSSMVDSHTGSLEGQVDITEQINFSNQDLANFFKTQDALGVKLIEKWLGEENGQQKLFTLLNLLGVDHLTNTLEKMPEMLKHVCQKILSTPQPMVTKLQLIAVRQEVYQYILLQIGFKQSPQIEAFSFLNLLNIAELKDMIPRLDKSYLDILAYQLPLSLFNQFMENLSFENQRYVLEGGLEGLQISAERLETIAAEIRSLLPPVKVEELNPNWFKEVNSKLLRFLTRQSFANEKKMLDYILEKDPYKLPKLKEIYASATLYEAASDEALRNIFNHLSPVDMARSIIYFNNDRFMRLISPANLEYIQYEVEKLNIVSSQQTPESAEKAAQAIQHALNRFKEVTVRLYRTAPSSFYSTPNETNPAHAIPKPTTMTQAS